MIKNNYREDNGVCLAVHTVCKPVQVWQTSTVKQKHLHNIFHKSLCVLRSSEVISSDKERCFMVTRHVLETFLSGSLLGFYPVKAVYEFLLILVIFSPHCRGGDCPVEFVFQIESSAIEAFLNHSFCVLKCETLSLVQLVFLDFILDLLRQVGKLLMLVSMVAVFLLNPLFIAQLRKGGKSAQKYLKVFRLNSNSYISNGVWVVFPLTLILLIRCSSLFSINHIKDVTQFPQFLV